MELPTPLDSFAVMAEEAEAITIMLEKQFATRFTDLDKGFTKAMMKDPDEPIIAPEWVGNEGRRTQHRDRFVRDSDPGRRGGGWGGGGRGGGGRGGGRPPWRNDRREGRFEDGDRSRGWGQDRRDNRDRRDDRDRRDNRDRRDFQREYRDLDRDRSRACEGDDRGGEKRQDRSRSRSRDRGRDRGREANRGDEREVKRGRSGEREAPQQSTETEEKNTEEK